MSKKCSLEKQTFCKPMGKFADSQYGSGRRIFVSDTMNFKTGEERKRAGYFFGRKKNEYIWLNFCPWCGGVLHDQEKKGALSE